MFESRSHYIWNHAKLEPWCADCNALRRVYTCHGDRRYDREGLIIEMKKLWIEEHLGIKLNWYQRIWFWPQDRKMRRKHQRLLEKIEELNRRDQFLQKVEDEMHPRWDADGSCVATIPDIDIDALLKEADKNGI